MKKYLSFLLALLFSIGILASCHEPLPGEGATDEAKNPTSVNREDLDISEEDVIVVIEAKFNDKVYTVKDFADVGCVELYDLTVGEVKPHHLCRIFHIKIKNPSKENVWKAIDILQERDDIYSAEPSIPIHIDEEDGIFPDATPTDTYVSSTYQWAINKLWLASAWNITTGLSSIRVGVIDTGIDATHPDLTNRVDRTMSRSFSPDYSNALEDTSGHGTHVAGIIGAQGDNGIGIAGVCWDVTLVSLRVDRTDGTFYDLGILNAIQYATNQDIPILNFSGSWTGQIPYGPSIKIAIKNYPGLFVCSAGNSSANNDTSPVYPSDYKYENLISVGASTEDDIKGPRSNYGATKVDLFAPGYVILSCTPISLCQNGNCNTETHESNGYHYKDGTSMAAPYVAGVAALLLSRYPTMTTAQLKKEILENVTTVSALQNLCLTDGRLNAYQTLNNVTCVHSYSQRYVSVSSTGHTAYCTCGDNISQAHTFTQSGNSLICTKCGYSSISLNNTDPEVELQ